MNVFTSLCILAFYVFSYLENRRNQKYNEKKFKEIDFKINSLKNK